MKDSTEVLHRSMRMYADTGPEEGTLNEGFRRVFESLKTAFGFIYGAFEGILQGCIFFMRTRSGACGFMVSRFRGSKLVSLGSKGPRSLGFEV